MDISFLWGESYVDLIFCSVFSFLKDFLSTLRKFVFSEEKGQLI